MRALSLHQPWASLIAEGVKTIETRSWATKYRGPLAIHAAKRRPPLMHIPPMIHRGSREERDHHNHQTWLVIDTITDPAYQRPLRQSERVPKRATTPTLFYPHAGPHGRSHDPKRGRATDQGAAIYLPLGAILATAILVDVVPIIDGEPYPPYHDHERVFAVDRDGVLRNWQWSGYRSWIGSSEYADQRPYGDFSPGHFAWLLADVVKLPEPIPFRGRQGLWTLPDDVEQGLKAAA